MEPSPSHQCEFKIRKKWSNWFNEDDEKRRYYTKIKKCDICNVEIEIHTKKYPMLCDRQVIFSNQRLGSIGEYLELEEKIALSILQKVLRYHIKRGLSASPVKFIGKSKLLQELIVEGYTPPDIGRVIFSLLRDGLIIIRCHNSDNGRSKTYEDIDAIYFDEERFQNIRIHLGVQTTQEKVERIKNLFNQVSNQAKFPQSQVILSILKDQTKQIYKFEKTGVYPAFFDKIHNSECRLKLYSSKYEGILEILIGMHKNVESQSFITTTDFCKSLNINTTSFNHYKSTIEGIIGSELLYFGILKSERELYIDPVEIPIELSLKRKRFETLLRQFFADRLIDQFGTAKDAFNSGIPGNILKRKKMLFSKRTLLNKLQKDLKEKARKKPSALIIKEWKDFQRDGICTRILLLRFFEQTDFNHLILLIQENWDLIFSKVFTDDVNSTLNKIRIIKGDRNIDSHQKSSIPDNFRTLTYMYEIYSAMGVH